MAGRSPCLGCGKPIPRGTPRCNNCKSPHSYKDQEYLRNRQVILNAWIRDHGYTCPGDPEQNHAAHACTNKNPLTADHVISMSNWHKLGLPGSPHVLSNLRPMCRQANGKRGSGQMEL